MSKINAHPDHPRRSGGKLSAFGGELAEGGQKLQTAGQNLVSHASNDKSGIGAVVAKAMGRGVDITGKVFSEAGRVVEGAGKRLGTTADLYDEADGKGAGLLTKLHPDTKGELARHGGGVRAASTVGTAGGGRGRSARAHAWAGDATTPCQTQGAPRLQKDSSDLATGEVLATQWKPYRSPKSAIDSPIISQYSPTTALISVSRRP